MPVTIRQIETKYKEDRERIREIRRAAEAEVAQIEKFQKAREDYILATDDVEAFGFLTDIYLNGRDGKAEAEKRKENIAVDMKRIEEWLLKMLTKVGDGIRTEFGTVYKTRKEAVSVADFDAYFEAEIIRPAVKTFLQEYSMYIDGIGEYDESLDVHVTQMFKASLHLEALTKAANKTYVLEKMGEQDKKTGARPNPAPPGVNYLAFQTIGVRKPGKD